MKSWSEVKLRELTNKVQSKYNEHSKFPNEIMKYYNELVQSDFSQISSSAVTFSKEPRFKENHEVSPGPGYYNPQKKKLSNYTKSQIYPEMHSIMEKQDFSKSFY